MDETPEGPEILAGMDLPVPIGTTPRDRFAMELPSPRLGIPIVADVLAILQLSTCGDPPDVVQVALLDLPESIERYGSRVDYELAAIGVATARARRQFFARPEGHFDQIAAAIGDTMHHWIGGKLLSRGDAFEYSLDGAVWAPARYAGVTPEGDIAADLPIDHDSARGAWVRPSYLVRIPA